MRMHDRTGFLFSLPSGTISLILEESSDDGMQRGNEPLYRWFLFASRGKATQQQIAQQCIDLYVSRDEIRERFGEEDDSASEDGDLVQEMEEAHGDVDSDHDDAAYLRLHAQNDLEGVDDSDDENIEVRCVVRRVIQHQGELFWSSSDEEVQFTKKHDIWRIIKRRFLSYSSMFPAHFTFKPRTRLRQEGRFHAFDALSNHWSFPFYQ